MVHIAWFKVKLQRVKKYLRIHKTVKVVLIFFLLKNVLHYDDNAFI